MFAAAEAFENQAWAVAYRLLAEAPRENLSPDDLERLAVAAYLTGRDDAAVEAWAQAYRRCDGAGDRPAAARCAFWAAFASMMQGQMAYAGGWLSRGGAVLGDDIDCPARGYLLIPALLGALDSADARGAAQLAADLRAIADRFQDRDLRALATLGDGQARLALGDADAGLARLDEAMLTVTTDEIGPIVAGIVYCAVILECMQLFELARATEWTAALEKWCRTQPDLVPYRGQCLVHRSQLRQAAGDWAAAMTAVVEARNRLSDPPHPALGLAWYQQGELCRLRGDVDAASEAYRQAGRVGHEPTPGSALLELQRGEAAAAGRSIRRALAEAGQPFRRPGLLAAAVEIHLAGGEVAAAEEAATELASLAEKSSSAALGALAAQAGGATLLATGRAGEAVSQLRAAGAVRQRLSMPYDSARNAVLVGIGCAALGDHQAATLSFEDARAGFTALGAEPDLRRLADLMGGAADEGPLSARELEVLRLVAQSRTSQEIAAALGISRHTVRRHVENVFARLGVSSRAAAVAYAYEHGLLERRSR